MNDCEILASVPYFKGLKQEIICSILDYAMVRKIPDENYLFHAGDICKNLYIIKEGLIEIFQLGDDGKKMILHHAGRGAFLGDTLLFEEGKHEAHSSAKGEVEVLVVQKKHLEKLIFEYPEIARNMLIDFSGRIKNLKSLVAEIALRDVNERIVKLLLEFAKNGSGHKDNKIILNNLPTQDEMAHRIGTVREVLCRGLHSLERAKVIKVKRGNIILYDIQKLKAMIDSEEEGFLFPIMLPLK